MDTVTQFSRRAWIVGLTLIVSLLSATSGARAQRLSPLLISEVYYDTPGVDGDEEWAEITNTGDAAVSLDGFKIGDEETPGGAEGMSRFPLGAALQPQQSAVVAQTATGFRTLFGFSPDFELRDSDAAVPDMQPYEHLARGDFALNNDGDELLLLDANDVVVDAVSYGDSTVFMAPSVLDVFRGQSIARIPAYCDTDTAADWQPLNHPTPGATQLEGDCSVPSSGADSLQLLSIGAIQGHGDASPLINQTVSFEGVITGLLEDRNARGAIFYTLFVQEYADNEDGDPSTSDAIAVFHGPRRPPYAQGDLIRVTGQVTEFYGFTEIDHSGLRIELLDTGHPLPPPIPLELPSGSIGQGLEALEAMRVALPQAFVVGPTFSGCGFAVTPGARPRRFLRQRLSDVVDEIVPVLHVSDVSCGDFPQVKAGDVVHGLDGPLVYHFDQFKIVHQRTAELIVAPAEDPPVPPPPSPTTDQATVATFNLHDFFDAIDDTRSDAEPKPEPEEVQIKQTKLAQTIATALNCPTLLAVQEVENAALLQSLAQELQSSCGFHYAVAHQESPDARGIDLGLMVDPRRAQIVSVLAEQHCSPVLTDLPEIGVDCPTGQDPLFSRPPLRVHITLDSESYTVVVTHFKSKREGEEETAPRRLAQAEVVARLVREMMAREAEARIIVLGDFNDYEQSATMALLTADAVGLFNSAQVVAVEQRYTYNFGGVSQLLDAILLSPALHTRLVSSYIMHVNADFPAGWAANPQTVFRSSDHDIPMVVLRTTEVSAAPDAQQTAAETRATPADSTAFTLPTPTITVADATPVPAPGPVARRGGPILAAGLLLLALGGGALLYRRRNAHG